MIELSEFTKETYTDDHGTSLPYRFYDPKLGENRPLLVFLHGAGERGIDNDKHLSVPVSPFVPDYGIDFEKYGAYYLVPQCAEGHQWVDTPWAEGAYDQSKVPISKHLYAAKALIDDIVEKYKIDKNRIYITGCSMGGFGTWDMITRFPGYFRAAMPICGGGAPAKAELIKDMPIWTFHGDADSAVPVDGTREMYEALKACGSDAIYTEIKGWGHHAWKFVNDSKCVYDWLFTR